MSTLIADSSMHVGLAMISNTVDDAVEKSMVNRWLKEYEAYRRRKTRRRAILSAVGEGYDTVSEISAHTGISEASVRRITAELIEKKKLQSAKTKNTNCRIELRFELT